MSSALRKYSLSQALTILWPDLLTKRLFSVGPPLHSTSWMNGLRALAAIAISTYHILSAFIVMDDRGPLEALCLFFILGGYGASRRPLELMMTPGAQNQVLQALSTSIFRRWFRLYVPTLAALLLTTLCAYFGAFEALRPLLAEPHRAYFFPGSMTPKVPRQWRTVQKQLAYWSRDAARLMDLRPAEAPKIMNSAYVWSVPEEFTCSMYLYVVLVGTARMKPLCRVSALVILSWYASWCGSWEGMLFGFGAVVAQLELLIKVNSLSQNEDQRANVAAAIRISDVGANPTPVPAIQHSTFWIQGLGFPLAICLVSTRSNGLVPLIQTYLCAQHARIACCGAGIVVFLLCMLCLPPETLLHKLLNSPILQYVYRRAFGMVLLQTIVLYSGALAVPHLVWSVTGGDIRGLSQRSVGGSYSRSILGLALGCIVNVIALLWASDIFTKLVLMQNEGLIKMVEHWCYAVD
jgi:hypothetical protein